MALAVGALLWRGRAVEEVPIQASTKPTGAVGPAAYAETDRTLAAIRDELQRSIEARQDRLPPETRALVFENLRTIDRAIARDRAGTLIGARQLRTHPHLHRVPPAADQPPAPG